MTRPTTLVFFSGTGTEVGKTWWAAAVIHHLRAHGLAVAARKPAQSSAPADATSDADVLAAATGEAPETVCPDHRRYEVPMAPPMAADALERPSFTIADLVAEIMWPPGTDIGIVEGAGGPRSPLARDGDNVDLACALAPDLVVLVADAGLGTINAVRLSADALAAFRLIVALNRYEEAVDLHRRNRAWLGAHTALEVVTTPDELATAMAGGVGRQGIEP